MGLAGIRLFFFVRGYMLREALIIKFADRYELVGINYGVGESNFYKQNINSDFFLCWIFGSSHRGRDRPDRSGQCEK